MARAMASSTDAKQFPPNANKVTAMINRLTNRALSIRIDRLNHVAGYLVNPLDRGRRNLLAYQR